MQVQGLHSLPLSTGIAFGHGRSVFAKHTINVRRKNGRPAQLQLELELMGLNRTRAKEIQLDQPYRYLGTPAGAYRLPHILVDDVLTFKEDGSINIERGEKPFTLTPSIVDTTNYLNATTNQTNSLYAFISPLRVAFIKSNS